MRKTYRQQKVRQTNSFRSNNSSSKRSGSGNSSKPEVTLDQVSILKEELEITWKKFSITEQHQRLFLSALITIPKMQAAVRIAREIDCIEKGNSNIISAINAIETREEKLIDFSKHLKIEKFELVFYAKLIENLREITFKVIDFIEIWKNEISCKEAFLYHEQSYYEKMKTDCDFISESWLCKYFILYKSDPLFSGPTSMKRVGKRVFSVPYSSKLTNRLKKAQETIGINPIKPEKTRSEATGEVPISAGDPLTSSVSLFFQTEVAQQDPEYKKFLSTVSKLISEDLLQASVQSNIESLIIESLREIIIASLTLHSSSILDKIITEVLNEMIPSIARNSHTEVTDSEYLDIRNLILNEVFEEETLRICSSLTNNILSFQLNSHMFSHFDLTDLVVESIGEEKLENMKIVTIVADKLMEEFINSEFIEDLAELELINAKMECAWIGLPPHIQREIYAHQKKAIIGRLAEMVYFDVLNGFVAGFWIDALVRGWCEGREIEDDELCIKDPNWTPSEDSKRIGIMIRKK